MQKKNHKSTKKWAKAESRMPESNLPAGDNTHAAADSADTAADGERCFAVDGETCSAARFYH